MGTQVTPQMREVNVGILQTACATHRKIRNVMGEDGQRQAGGEEAPEVTHRAPSERQLRKPGQSQGRLSKGRALRLEQAQHRQQADEHCGKPMHAGPFRQPELVAH